MKKKRATRAFSFVITEPPTIAYHIREHRHRDTICGLMHRDVTRIFKLRIKRVPKRALSKLGLSFLCCNECAKALPQS